MKAVYLWIGLNGPEYSQCVFEDSEEYFRRWKDSKIKCFERLGRRDTYLKKPSAGDAGQIPNIDGDELHWEP